LKENSKEFYKATSISGKRILEEQFFYEEPKIFSIVLALAGDSTITNLFLSNFLANSNTSYLKNLFYSEL